MIFEFIQNSQQMEQQHLHIHQIYTSLQDITLNNLNIIIPHDLIRLISEFVPSIFTNKLDVMIQKYYKPIKLNPYADRSVHSKYAVYVPISYILYDWKRMFDDPLFIGEIYWSHSLLRCNKNCRCNKIPRIIEIGYGYAISSSCQNYYMFEIHYICPKCTHNNIIRIDHITSDGIMVCLICHPYYGRLLPLTIL